MLKKLRNKFILINLSGMIILTLVAFITIFIITSSNINRQIDSALNRGLFTNQNFDRKNFPQNNNHILNESPQINDTTPPQPNIENEKDLTLRNNLNDSRSFSIKVDENGEISKIYALFDSQDLYTEVAKQVISFESETGTFKSDSIYWQYKTRNLDDGSRIISLMDITSEKNILFHLMLTFIFVGLILVVLIFMISLYFANRAISPVKDAWDKQKQFIADASHELKTPLAIIGTNIDVIMSHENNKVLDERKWLQYIKDEVLRMTNLTKDLLFLAKIEDGNLALVKENVDISYLTESSILTMEAVTFEKNISLKYNIEPKINILADPSKIKQVVMILIDNAIKYTPVNGEIKVSLTKEKNNVKLSVKNSGVGIAEKDLPHIFDRFYKADESRADNNGSFGLGLAIAKAIVEKNHGRIFATSKENEYTVFNISFPITK